MCSRWPWQDKYLTIKIINCFESDRGSAGKELRISQHIQSLYSSHIGMNYVRLVKDSFTIRGPRGEHLCLSMSLFESHYGGWPATWAGKGYLFDYRKVSCGTYSMGLTFCIRNVISFIQVGYLFFHSTGVHLGRSALTLTIIIDLKAEKILLAFEDGSVIDKYVQERKTSRPT